MTERKLAAILSADVVGYSRLNAADEAATVQTLESHSDLMSGLILQDAGRVMDAVGDRLLAEFPGVEGAVACAAAIQKEIASRNATLPEQLADPGGICISGAVREQLRGTLDLEYEDLGDQQVKNIPPSVVARAMLGTSKTAHTRDTGRYLRCVSGVRTERN